MNERWVGDVSQAEFDALVDENRAMRKALVLADGSLTWCKARHASDEATEEAIRAVLAFTRNPAMALPRRTDDGHR
jgi:hypothetical protein